MRIAYDISHYKIVKDFRLINPKPAILITKATEGHPGSTYNHTDSTFVNYFDSMMDIGVVRGAYHFFRKSLNPYKQAEHFLNTISKVDILKTDILVLDVEEGGEKAPQLWAWCETIRKDFPNNRLWIYSRENILGLIPMTQSEKEYFKKIPIWTAGYPTPKADYYLSEKVPTAYVPDQSRFGEVVMWQYTSKGEVSGIVGGVDLNWIDPKMYESLEYPEVVSKNGEFTYISPTKLGVFSRPGGKFVETLSPNIRINSDSLINLYGHTYLQVSNGWVKLDVQIENSDPTTPGYIEVFIDGVLKVSGFGKFEVK